MKKSKSQKNRFASVSPEMCGIPSSAIIHLLDEFEQNHIELHGLQIMRHGMLCAEGWWYPYTRDLAHGVQSVSKTFTLVGIGAAIQKGLLSLDDRIVDLFPEYAPAVPSKYLSALKLRHLLCMGCGMETEPDPSVDWISAFLHTPIRHEPGTTFYYNSTSSTFLAAVIQKVTGKDLHRWLCEEIYPYIGIDGTDHRWLTMPDGTPIGAGGLFCKTEDMLRLIKLLADGGRVSDRQLIPEEFVKETVRYQNKSHDPNGITSHIVRQSVCMGYGYQVWLCCIPGCYRADGAMGQFALVFPHEDLIVVINESTSRPELTLDVLFRILLPALHNTHLPDNQEEYARLRRRLSSLHIPDYRPEAVLHSPSPRESKTFHILSGRLSFRIRNFMSPTDEDILIRSFRFSFGKTTSLAFREGKDEYVIQISDGRDFETNRLPPKQLPVSLCLASGCWVSSSTYELHLRWPETCYELAYTFSFSPDSCIVQFKYANDILIPPYPGEFEKIISS